MSIAGCFPDIRLVNIRDYSPGDTVTLCGDTWHTFPVARKGDPVTGRTPNTDGNSGWYGIAYKEIA